MPSPHAAAQPAPQLLTREFAETIAGKVPSPYLRAHDPAQRWLAEFSASVEGQDLVWQAYCETAIHFWREVSLMGLVRPGRGADECHALLFESVFDLARARPEWAAECLGRRSSPLQAGDTLHALARHMTGNMTHSGLVQTFAALQAFFRERDPRWQDDRFIIERGEIWFWAAIYCATQVDENHRLGWLGRAVTEQSEKGWDDFRLHAQLIREVPRRALTAARAELQAHPLLRLARLKYREDSAEQAAVLEFLNVQCLRAGFESEEDCFYSDLTLACWVRDARRWADELRRRQPRRHGTLVEECAPAELARVRALFHESVGPNPGPGGRAGRHPGPDPLGARVPGARTLAQPGRNLGVHRRDGGRRPRAGLALPAALHQGRPACVRLVAIRGGYRARVNPAQMPWHQPCFVSGCELRPTIKPSRPRTRITRG